MASVILAALLLILVFPFPPPARARRYTISTIAGSDSVGDGGPAKAALLDRVAAIAFDRMGRMLIADSLANRIRVVTPDRGPVVRDYPNGRISTFGGVGWAGFSGDGGPAVDAYLDLPKGLTVDQVGNVYIAEISRVRMVDSQGVIRTVAGGGSETFTEDGVMATTVSLRPIAIAIDQENTLYISALHVDGAGVLVQPLSSRIYRVTPEGKMSHFAGGGDLGLEADGGSALRAALLGAVALAVNSDGNVYVAEPGRGCVRMLTPGGVISTLAGTGVSGSGGDEGPASQAQLRSPAGLVVDGEQNLVILDSLAVRKVSRDGVIHTVVTLPFLGSALAMDPDGGLWIGTGQTISTPSGTQVYSRIGQGVPDCRSGTSAAECVLTSVGGVTVDPWGLTYLVAGPRILVMDRYGIIFSSVGIPAGVVSSPGGDGVIVSTSVIPSPTAVVADQEGNLWIGDGSRIRKVTRVDGVIRAIAGSGLGRTSRLALDNNGNVFIPTASSVRKIGADGLISTIAGTERPGYSGDDGPAVLVQLDNPQGLAADRQGNLYIADSGNRRIRMVSSAGLVSTIAGGGLQAGDGIATGLSIDTPLGIAATAAGSIVFSTNTAIYEIDGSGWMERIAGDGLPGHSGDGGPALKARLSSPAALWANADGSILVVESRWIRKLTPE